MIKLFKAVGLLLIVTLPILYITNEQIFKILWFLKPTTQTYTHFPTRTISHSPSPFYFVYPKSNLYRLDTLQVDYHAKGLTPFSRYFNEGKLLAFLVIKNDTVVYEKYAPGFQENTKSNTFSIGKTMISVLLGEALEAGYIKSLNQKLTEFIPELKNKPAFKHITIKNLIEMKSGLSFKRFGENFFSDIYSDEARFYYTDDLKRDLQKVKTDTIPGAKWHYSNIDVLLLTWAIERSANKHISTYFKEEVWDKIGSQYDASWGLDREGGLENTPSSFQCTAIDLAKIGRLYLNNGIVKTDTVITQSWIKESIFVSASNKNNTAKGWQKSTHQNYWWIPQDNANMSEYLAEGLRGQRLYINPKNKIIIVQFAESGFGGFPYRKISNYFIK
jgi:CubicO group peptidase (beta-lactamase class C family)